MSVASSGCHGPTAERLRDAQDRILSWYGAHARDLPWRRSRDPYAILVSEIMLQQTQVDRVIPKFLEFVERFPSLQRLAEAPLSDVLRAWAPLGYNRRARNLHLAARETVGRFGGVLPTDVSLLRSLPGIGRYTAAAVACFAHNAPVATVDTNIRRVLSRLFLANDRPASEAEVWRMAVDALPADHASAWNQALMDLGATICASGTPRCLVCPAREVCSWYLDGVPLNQPTSRVAEAPARYAAKADPGAMRRKARGRIVQALREVEHGLWLAWPELRSEIQSGVPGAESLDLDLLLDDLIMDGLVQDRLQDGTRRVALAE